jgi:hypothetical protein
MKEKIFTVKQEDKENSIITLNHLETVSRSEKYDHCEKKVFSVFKMKEKK